MKKAELGSMRKDNIFKASRTRVVMHCKLYGGPGNNFRSCPNKTSGPQSQPSSVTSDASQSSQRTAQTQPPKVGRKRSFRT
ncbi:hypothetical protein LIER_39224 [Lithospermum erythrorhizon]|uniref:Uncharacterized protein n=1 Tax=Lithospermum erythrorhizon TaxID=34254 RepID=A0AAV3QBE2_LITER